MTVKAIQRLLHKAITNLNQGLADGTIDPESIFVDEKSIAAHRIPTTGDTVAHRHTIRINFIKYQEPDKELAGNSDQIDLFSALTPETKTHTP